MDRNSRAKTTKAKKLAAIIVSGIIAIALGLTCGLCFGTDSKTATTSGVESGSVSSSVTQPTANNGTVNDYTPSGALKNGDVLNFSYVNKYRTWSSNRYYTVLLPKGTYKFEVWGARGGQGNDGRNARYNSSWNYGKGGYSYGTITIDTATTFYIYNGGMGEGNSTTNLTYNNQVVPGGYNGGGDGYHDGGEFGAGGGGATHIATRAGLLSSLSSYKSDVIIVAGAGGGSGEDNEQAGDGGGTTGVEPYGNDSRYNGTQTSGGANTSNASLSGKFGQGANYANSGESGGGGGGGWYGGGGGWGGGSGGGSGYVNTSRLTNARTIAGNTSFPAPSGGNETGHNGAGYSRITAIQVNQAPVTKTAPAFELGARGTGKSVSVNASAIAEDKDFSNYGGASSYVHFTDGNASASNKLDTVTKNDNNLRLENGASAKSYLDWTINENTITITGVKKYPRRGVDGSTQADGTLKLTTKVRDRYGNNTSRGVGDVTFTVHVTDNEIVMRSTPNAGGAAVTDKGTYIEYNKSGTGGTYTYRVGNSDKNTVDDQGFDYIGSGHVYNPKGEGRKTVFVVQPLTPSRIANVSSPMPNDGFTISAADIYSDGDTLANMNDIVGIRSVALDANAKDYYRISYNANSTLYGSTGLNESITITPTALRPSTSIYVSVIITAASCEQLTKRAFTDFKEVELVFKIANTRPLYASASGNTQNQDEPVVTLKTGGNPYDLDLSSFIYDPDGTTPTFDTRADSLVVPMNEYVAVTLENTRVKLKQGVSHTNYSDGSGNLGIVDSSFDEANESGQGDKRIWREGLAQDKIERVIAQSGSPSASSAWVTYSYIGNSTIRFTPRAASQYMYADSGRDGDFYVLVRVVDPGDTTDDGIWFPIAIKVESSAPREPSTTANITLSFDGFVKGNETADGNAGGAQSAYFTPIGYTDANGALHGIGVTHVNNVFDNGAEHALPFVTDNDNFAFGASATRSSEYNEIVALAGSIEEDVIDACGTSEFFEVSIVKMYAQSTVFANLSQAVQTALGIMPLTDEEAELTTQNRTSIKSFYGLKVTAKSATNNKYYEFDVKVKDSHGTVPEAIEGVTAGSVRVYVKVENRAPSLRRNPAKDDDGEYTSPRTDYPFNTTEYGKYTPQAGARVASINYKIVAEQEIIITPYDLAYDFDGASELNVKTSDGYTFNTNPLDGQNFVSAAEKILAKYDVKSTELPSVAAKPEKVSRGALMFDNKDRFDTAAAAYSDYVIASIEDNFYKDGELYTMSCVKLKAVSRTTANNPLLNITISDGVSTVDFAISITVENAKPYLKDPNAYFTLTAGKSNKLESSVQLIAWQPDKDVNDGLAADVDKDTVFFDNAPVRVVAYNAQAKEYYDRLTDNKNGTYTPSEDGAILLSDYIDASITGGTKEYIGQQVLLIRAKSSTQLFDVPIYVEFGVVDSWKAQPGYATLRICVEVLNTSPTFESGLLTEGADENSGKKFWYMPYETTSQKAAARYIVNDRDLYNSSAIPASASNKMLLFDDIDSQQTVLLDTGADENVISSNLIVKANPNSNDVPTLNANNFATGTAIMYTRTYPSTLTGIGKDDFFLDVSVVYYSRSGSAEEGYTFTEINDTATHNNLDENKYWAICIRDKANTSSTANNTQIAIRVKDDHYNKTVYAYDKETKKLAPSKDKNTSSGLTVCNFYYQYLQPGIRVMHDYYRTDGQAESGVLADPSKPSGDFKVDIDYLSGDMFADKIKPANQDALKDAKFSDRFKYRYFVNIVNADSDNQEAEVGKRYDGNTADKAFYYEPVELSESVTVPMSYLAMPKSFDITKGTAAAGESHVIPANVGKVQDYSAYTDGAFTSTEATPTYVSWVGNADYEKLILDNLTLTDSDGNTWKNGTGSPLNDNPYIKIEYTANQNKLATPYINYTRGELTYSGGTTVNNTFTGNPKFDSNSATSPYLEDRYGFKISRKEGSARYIGLLRLTAEVKTSTATAKVETAFVDIELGNSSPSFTYKSNENIVEVDTGASSDGTDIGLTMINSEGSAPGAYVTFVRDGGTATFPQGAEYTYALNFKDGDSTDVIMFYMPTATSGVIGGENGALTQAEIKALSSDKVSDDSLTKYLRITNESQATESYLKTYVPNPGYENFFTVSNVKGSTRTLQILPKAKTSLNIPVPAKKEGEDDSEYAERCEKERKAYLTANNLEEDAHGIYYPFRVLAYDSCNGSGFTDGNWVLVVINVHISNTPISANTVAETKLTKGVASTLDVSTLIKDNDIPLADGKYTTNVSQWSDLPHNTNSNKVSENAALARDLLVMPIDESGNVVFTATDSNDRAVDVDSLPISVSVDKVSPTTLVFNAKSAFKTQYKLTFTFKDSSLPDPSQVSVTVPLRYSNEAPTENADTFEGSALHITMRTGDSFTINAADVTKFQADVDGNFNSPSYFNAISDSYPQQSAEALKTAFEKFIGSYDEAEAEARNHDLGALIVASDDAPSTVRFLSSGTYMEDENLRSIVTVECSNYISNEGSGTNPVTATVTAHGVVTNAPLVISLIDSEGQQHLTSLRIYITVQSTAPVVNDDAPEDEGVTLPADMTRGTLTINGVDKTVYDVSLKYGEVFEHEFEQFMFDADDGDKDGLKAPAIYDGLTYKVENSKGLDDLTISPVKVSTTSNLDRGNYIRIEATDYIPVKGEYTLVTFRVTDEHGTQSEEVVLRITIEPEEMNTVSTVAHPASIAVQSYLQYANKPEKQVIELVSDSDKAEFVYDNDASAPSAMYDVNVYAMLKKAEDGSVSVIRRLSELVGEVKENALIFSVKAGVAETPTNSDIYKYVTRYFEFTVSADGKTITFVPNAANINTNGELNSISLYMEVGKRYKTDSSTVMSETGEVLTSVTVANSKPEATKSDGLNYGYPMKAGSDELRNENFLEFSGYAGESLTWDLCNPDDETLGLFRDYDMLRNKSGNEKLVFIAARLGAGSSVPTSENILEDKTKPNDPVLSVTSDEIKGTLTIKINRKVKDGTLPRSVIPVDIYVADKNTKKNYDDKNATLADCVKTTIMVTVMNSAPRFKEVDDVAVHRYTLSYDSQNGYEMFVTLAKNSTLIVNLEDILADTDIDFDKYEMVNTDSPCLTERPSDNPGAINNASGVKLFEFYAVGGNNEYGYRTIRSINFKGVSTERGETAVCHMMLADSSGARTSKLTIYLTVGNIAPKQKTEEVRHITVMGIPLGSENFNAQLGGGKNNVVYYVTDENPKDAIDVATDYDPEAAEKKSNSFVYIDRFNLYSTENADSANMPYIYGPGKVTEIEDEKGGETITIEATTACGITWADEYTHQTFAITLQPGVYGTQRIDLRCYDGGYMDGESAGITDAQSVIVELVITVACPVEDSDLTEPVKIAESVSRKITPEMLLNTKDEPQRAEGYAIKKIEAEGNLRVVAPTAVQASAVTSASDDGDIWRVQALRRGGNADKIRVTFDVGGIERVNTFNVLVTENKKPNPITKTIKFTKNELREGNIITISPEQWFDDEDIDDVVRFVSPVKVSSSQYADVFLHENTNSIDIKFKYRGSTKLTVTVTDATNKLYTWTDFTIECTDMPEPGWFTTFIGDIEAHPVRWGLIFGGILLFIIFLIVLLVILHKRRKMRREIEALLNSEAELNDEMMRLSGGVGSTMYQSYGYLPPTSQTYNDPGLMLGSSANNPTPNSLQLGMGTGQNTGVQPNGYPQSNPRYNNIPVDSVPGNMPPVNSVPGSMPPVNSAPGNNPPVNSAPGNNPPVNSAPGNKPPINSAPGRTQYNGMPGNMPNNSDGFDPDSF